MVRASVLEHHTAYRMVAVLDPRSGDGWPRRTIGDPTVRSEFGAARYWT